jgi:hypothetical protein
LYTVNTQQEVIEQLTELRAIMHRNYENGNVDKIPNQRWCSGDGPWLFRERWEKIFDDWVGVKQEKFDPSRVRGPLAGRITDTFRFPSCTTVSVVMTSFKGSDENRSSTTRCTIACSSSQSSILSERATTARLVPHRKIDVRVKLEEAN